MDGPESAESPFATTSATCAKKLYLVSRSRRASAIASRRRSHSPASTASLTIFAAFAGSSIGIGMNEPSGRMRATDGSPA